MIVQRTIFGILTLSSLFIFFLTIEAQPPQENKDFPFSKEKKSPPKFKPGMVLPPFAMEVLELTPEQRTKLKMLENKVSAELNKILSKEQLNQMTTLRPKGSFEKNGPGIPGERKGLNLPDQPSNPINSDYNKSINLPIFQRDNLEKVQNKFGIIFPGESKNLPKSLKLQGNVEFKPPIQFKEFVPATIALDSHSSNLSASGSIRFIHPLKSEEKKRWYRISFRGMAERNFNLSSDSLTLQVNYFSQKGTNPLDGVKKELYPLILKDRKELAVNGLWNQNGGEVWKTFAFEFRLPFPEIDTLEIQLGFKNGHAKNALYSKFYVSEIRLYPIESMETKQNNPKKGSSIVSDPVPIERLIHLGGRWYYNPPTNTPSLTISPTNPLIIDASNANRLFYKDGNWTNPFYENMTAWLRTGYLDIQGNQVSKDRFIPDNVVIEFRDKQMMIVHAKNIPNHPTAQFPEYRNGGKMGNPSYIQEHNYTYYLPLAPKRNPNAIAMDKTNSNRALPMGSTGIAINGVVFYNPFDADNFDATNLMDRCCGHPSPDNRYHYHKYPVCVKSPFVDEGMTHSPLIGFAFDGFPIYGPYEAKSLMAKDLKKNALNEFNMHYDEVHGWHYHVTPGKYPYIIGGYWGEVDRRNFRKGR